MSELTNFVLGYCFAISAMGLFLALGDCEFKPAISGGGKPGPLIITWEHAETRNNVRGHHIIE